MELDPLYCDVIVQRRERFTGKKAEFADSKASLVQRGCHDHVVPGTKVALDTP